MAWWHYDDGAPAPWGKGRFDPEHLVVGLLLLVPAVLAVILGLRGGK